MNPLKVKKVQLGFSEQSPSLSEKEGKLSFYDSTTGNIRLDQLLGQRFLGEVSFVSKSLLGADHNTIGEAIEEANQGSLIVIYGGVYEESLTIDKSLHLICMGDVELLSEDATAITITSSNVSISDLKIKISNGVGNPVPYCVETTHTEVGNTLTLKNCILDVSDHVNARFFKSTRVTSYLYSCIFNGTGNIEIEGSSTNHLFGAVFPNILLSNIVAESHIVGDVSTLTLTNSSVTLNGSYALCNGDADSSLKKDVIVGSVSFDNTDNSAVVFDCPLPNDFYVVAVQNISNGEHPVVSDKTPEGFTITTTQAISEDVYFTVLQ